MDVNVDEKMDEVAYRLTPWGCLVATLDDYGVDHSHITPRMGAHMAQDFMELMGRMGHVERVGKGKAGVEIDVPAGFEAGDCTECPLAYWDDGVDECEYVCVLGRRYDECPLVVGDGGEGGNA